MSDTTQSTTYYRTTSTDHGATHTVADGGYYERIDNGVPQAKSALGDYIGFQRSNTPEVCASLAPAASLFAAIKGSSPGTYHIYRTTQDPDVDISDTAIGDFAHIEEVRYREPAETPITFQHAHAVDVTEQAITDVDLAYLPPGPYIIPEWADAVKDALHSLINTGSYPDDVAANRDALQRPNPEAYRDPYARP